MQSLDQRAQRLSALQATALALQSRLQSHALRLSGATEGVVTRPAAKVTAQPMEIESSFQGVLPGLKKTLSNSCEKMRKFVNDIVLLVFRRRQYQEACRRNRKTGFCFCIY